jgi:hypothetical protein
MFVAAVNAQGLLSIADFATLEEGDIKQLCANIRKPGVMVNIWNLQYDHPSW